VVAGRAGGIPTQFPAGSQSYLIDSVESCAERVLYLLRHPGSRGDLGRAGQEHVRRRFLTPRLVRDELRLVRELVDAVHDPRWGEAAPNRTVDLPE
jgi:trehalose synthase